MPVYTCTSPNNQNCCGLNVSKNGAFADISVSFFEGFRGGKFSPGSILGRGMTLCAGGGSYCLKGRPSREEKQEIIQVNALIFDTGMA